MAGGAGAQRANNERPPHNSDSGSLELGGTAPNAKRPALQPPQPKSHSGGGFDGPADDDNTPRPNPFGPSLGFDPAKPVKKESVITNIRVELPASAYGLDNQQVSRSILPQDV